MKQALFERISVVKNYRYTLILASALMFAMVGVQMYIPTLLATFIDDISNIKDAQQVIRYGVLSAICILVYASLNAIRFYMFSRVGNRVVSDLRKRLFNSLIRQEQHFFDNKQTGELVSRISSDVEMLKDAVTIDLAMLLRSVLTALVGFAMLVTLSYQLTILIILLTPIPFLLAKWLGKKARIYGADIQQSLANGIQVAQEYLSNVKVIYSNNVEDRVIKHFDTATDKTLALNDRDSRLFAFYQCSSTLSSMLSVLILVLCGSLLVVKGHFSLGQLSSFIIYAGLFSNAVGGISSFWGDWMRTLGATEELFALFDTSTHSKKTPKNILAIPKTLQDIIFDQVSFAYPSRPQNKVFENISFTIEAEKKTALVGRSGSGKSSIINLILGCYPISSGEIRFGRSKVDDFGIQAWIDQVSVVEQEPMIFSGSIKDNISFASKEQNVDIAKIEDAAKKANIHNFIMELPNGYDTVIGEKGAQLSGGQKQRIAIARAFLRDTNILILDEPTSALDGENAHLIKAALNELSSNRTTLVIAHSMTQVDDADHIIVMENGNILEQGGPEILNKLPQLSPAI